MPLNKERDESHQGQKQNADNGLEPGVRAQGKRYRPESRLHAPLAGSPAGMRRSGFLIRSTGGIGSQLLRTSDQSRSNRDLPLSKICEYCVQIKAEFARKLLPYSSNFRNNRVCAHGIILP